MVVICYEYKMKLSYRCGARGSYMKTHFYRSLAKGYVGYTLYKVKNPWRYS